MRYSRPDETRTVDTPHGIEARKIHENEHVQVMYLKLAPGESLRPHATPVDVFFYVLEGRGAVTIGDETVEVTAETIVDSPRDVPHHWRNTGDSVLRLLVVKTPKPGGPTRMLD